MAAKKSGEESKTSSPLSITLSSPSKFKDAKGDNKTQRSGVKALTELQKDRLLSILGKMEAQAEAGAASQNSEVAHPDYYSDINTFVTPRGLIDEEDNSMKYLFAECAKLLEASWRYYPGDAKKSEKQNDQWIIGVASGLALTSAFPTRSKGKKNYDLGRAEGFYLRVRAAFKNSKKLGLGALQHDPWFFGNPRADQAEMHLDIKTRFISQFEDSKIGVQLYKAFQKMVDRISLHDLEDSAFYKTIEANMRTFDSIVTTHYTPIVKRKKGKEITKYKKPQIPSRSLLLTSSELGLFKKVLSALWSDLDILKQDYVGAVYENHFETIKSDVGLIINQRNQLMSRFAKITTTRLQGIRSLDGQARLKKAGVTQALLAAFLGKRSAPAKELERELNELIGPKRWQATSQVLFGSIPTTRDEFRGRMYKLCMQAYAQDVESKEVEAGFTKLAFTEKEIGEAVVLFTDIRSKYAQVGKIVDTDRIIIRKLPGQIGQLIGLKKNLTTLIEKWQKTISLSVSNVLQDVKQLPRSTTAILNDDEKWLNEMISGFVKEARDALSKEPSSQFKTELEDLLKLL